VALDSIFALAWAQLARAHASIYYNGTGASADAEQGKAASQRATALAPNRPESHAAAGDYLYFVRGDSPGALAEYETGLRLAPSSAAMLSNAALAKQSLGHWDEADELLTRAQAIDPRSVQVARRLATTLIRLRRLPEARAATDRALSIAPTNLQVIESK